MLWALEVHVVSGSNWQTNGGKNTQRTVKSKDNISSPRHPCSLGEYSRQGSLYICLLLIYILRTALTILHTGFPIRSMQNPLLTHLKAFELHKEKTAEESMISNGKWVEDTRHQKYKEIYRWGRNVQAHSQGMVQWVSAWSYPSCQSHAWVTHLMRKGGLQANTYVSNGLLKCNWIGIPSAEET